MALKLFPLPIPFPIFAPPPPGQPPPDHHHRTAEVRFARWNNANAREFEERRRVQQEIESDLRRHRRFHSTTNIINSTTTTTTTTTNPNNYNNNNNYNFNNNNNNNFNDDNNNFSKSIGTPSTPSKPSIPGKKSKYSKPEIPKHPAFRHVSNKITKVSLRREEKEETIVVPDRKANVRVGEDGVSFVMEGAPFEFKYSYTETPKTRAVKLREKPFSPFGPETMPRPWTGKAPLPPSKKKFKEFDSFVLPPPHKKGVKPVQAPGPYLPGSGPRYVRTREEILGEPLTKQEVEDLVNGSLKSKRQLNMGRDGLTHNMLDNIHALWKRRRVCKIKCKGVCTVDMDNVCQQLEERTGGKIIYQKGGVLYLFRGRNYNFKLRPRFPLMLWKPMTPVYPRLIQRVPAGLTLEEASEMRKKGRKLIPICKLAKNGVYSNLAKDVREAFEVCELVRINCQGINGSDYRKIGAKLRDLVPCVLISFEHEHILMWRGRDWKPSLKIPVPYVKEAEGSNLNISRTLKDQKIDALSTEDVIVNESSVNASPMDYGKLVDLAASEVDRSCIAMDNSLSIIENLDGECRLDNVASCTSNESEDKDTINFDESPRTTCRGKIQDVSESSDDRIKQAAVSMTQAEGIMRLWKEAIESGSAAALEDTDLDADDVYQRAVTLAQSAPAGPVFRHKPRRIKVEKPEKAENENLDSLDGEEIIAVTKKGGNANKISKSGRRKEINEQFIDVAPQGTLKVDELAKLLA